MKGLITLGLGDSMGPRCVFVCLFSEKLLIDKTTSKSRLKIEHRFGFLTLYNFIHFLIYIWLHLKTIKFYLLATEFQQQPRYLVGERSLSEPCQTLRIETFSLSFSPRCQRELESNPRPYYYESIALPLCYLRILRYRLRLKLSFYQDMPKWYK